MNINDIVKKLKALIPVDKDISAYNISQVFHDINEHASIGDILRSNMMLISIITLLKMLYIDGLIEIREGCLCWKNATVISTPKLLNILYPEMFYKREESSKSIFNNRTASPNLSYFQSFNTYFSLIRRFNLMRQFGDISEKKVVFIGDDELFSVFYALNAVSYEKILVLDIDDKILDEINHYSDFYNLKIETKKFDVFLDDYHESEYDVFFASGLKKLAGLLMFILLGSKFFSINGDKTGYFTFYPYAENIEKVEQQQNEYNYNLQKTLIQYGFWIDHLSVCDEITISKSLIKKIVNWIIKDKNLLLTNDNYYNEFTINEELAADPLFPYFSLKPINIARIKQLHKNASKIDNYIKMTRRFRNDGN